MNRDIEPRLGDPIPEDWEKKALKEIKAQYRPVSLINFRGQDSVEVYIYQPTSRQDSLATDAYTKAFNRYLGQMRTKRQLTKYLEETGVWGSEEEKQMDNLRETMRDIEFEVVQMRENNSPNKARINHLRAKYKETREKLTELATEKAGLLANSVEGRAEEEEYKYRIVSCVKFPDGAPLWSCIEDLDNETDRFALSKIMNEALVFWSGLSQEIIELLPDRILFGGEESKSENSQET